MKYEKMLKKAGFCLWGKEPWRPNGVWVDWADNYDDAMVRLLLMFKHKLKKRDRKIATLQHELAKLKSERNLAQPNGANDE